MARKTELGTYILSAGEIGAYTVCPEAWRLSTVERVKSQQSGNVEKGHELHRQWASTYDEALALSRRIRAVVLLLVLTIAVYLLSTL